MTVKKYVISVKTPFGGDICRLVVDEENKSAVFDTELDKYETNNVHISEKEIQAEFQITAPIAGNLKINISKYGSELGEKFAIYVGELFIDDHVKTSIRVTSEQ